MYGSDAWLFCKSVWTAGVPCAFFTYFCAVQHLDPPCRMPHTLLRHTCLLLWWLLPLTAVARLEVADSIISHMHMAASVYAGYIYEYQAELYSKAQLDIIRRNFGFRYVPGLFRFDKHSNRFIVETYSSLHYTAPNIYDHKIKVYSGTLREARQIPGIMDCINCNIYSPYMMRDHILSPLAPNSHRYYTYHIDSVSVDEAQRLEYHIHFIPRNKSYELIDGRMVVTEGAWSVRRITFKGRSELLTFACDVHMGAVDSDTEYLVVKNDVSARFAFMGNELEGYYETETTYTTIKTRSNTPPEEIPHRQYNLTASYALQCDHQAYDKNRQRIDSLRPHPLTSAEQQIYKRHDQPAQANDSTEHNKTLRKTGEMMFTDNKWQLNANTTLRSAPFINPLFFSYSKSNGAAYRQDLKLNINFANESWLHLRTKVGYNFTYKELYWNAGAEYHYAPSRLGMLRVEVGNGNRISNSNIIDRIKAIPDTTNIDLDKLNIDVFQDLKLEVSNRIELCHGLELELGVLFHRRTPARHPDDSFREIQLPPDISEGLRENIRPEYNSFAPHLCLKWTPGQYYYMDGKRKVNLHARYPSILLDYERGIKGVLGSTGVYERMECDVQHRIRLGLRSQLCYRVGAGIFTNQEETYFVDFEHFRNSNIPRNWVDEIGGVFQALPSKWYNASPYYVRAHLTLNSPFLIMRHAMKYTNHIRDERLYLNLLTMKRLGPYFEVGYGIGTFVFDLGVFASLQDFKHVGFGYKITFELFDK